MATHALELQLERKYTLIYKEFIRIIFVVQPMSSQPWQLTRRNKRMNAKVKDGSGVINVIENDTAVRRWIVAGPKVTRIVDEFEGILRVSKKTIK